MGIVRAEYEEAYSELLKQIKVGAVPVANVFWSEMDFEVDLRRIRKFI